MPLAKKPAKRVVKQEDRAVIRVLKSMTSNLENLLSTAVYGVDNSNLASARVFIRKAEEELRAYLISTE